MLSAIAVVVSGFPDKGFYHLAKDLGFSFEESNESKQKFWESLCKEVYETWRTKKSQEPRFFLDSLLQIHLFS
jgi:hypothetical protein